MWCFCLSLQLWAFLSHVSTIQTCAVFGFPTLKSTTQTVQENAELTVAFRFYARCMHPYKHGFKISVGKGNMAHRCPTRLRDGRCRRSTDSWCSCMQARDMYQVKVTANRGDRSLWFRAETGDEMMSKKLELRLNVVYPATVTSLSLGSARTPDHVTERNDSLQVVCSWKNGNPPVTARLLDRHGVEMEGSNYSSGQIRYTFPAVGCQDAGLIRCEAPGARHNRSATLLVRCPPAIATENGTNLSVDAGQILALELSVRTHTTSFTVCRLRMLTSQVPDNDVGTQPPRDFVLPSSDVTNSSSCDLCGTPPNLMLTARLDNVRKEMEGQWRLELTNDAGTGQLDFSMLVTENSMPESFQKQDQEHQRKSIIIGTVTAAVLFAVVVTIAVVICKRGGRGAISSNRVVGRSGRDIERHPSLVSDHSVTGERAVQPTAPLYMSASTSPQSFGLMISHRPDYLTPAPDHQVAEGTDSASGVIPVYYNGSARPVGACALPNEQRQARHYLTPTLSPSAMKDAESARNTTPLYENSSLRPVGASALPGAHHYLTPTLSPGVMKGVESARNAGPVYKNSRLRPAMKPPKPPAVSTDSRVATFPMEPTTKDRLPADYLTPIKRSAEIHAKESKHGATMQSTASWTTARGLQDSRLTSASPLAATEESNTDTGGAPLYENSSMFPTETITPETLSHHRTGGAAIVFVNAPICDLE